MERQESSRNILGIELPGSLYSSYLPIMFLGFPVSGSHFTPFFKDLLNVALPLLNKIMQDAKSTILPLLLRFKRRIPQEFQQARDIVSLPLGYDSTVEGFELWPEDLVRRYMNVVGE